MQKHPFKDILSVLKRSEMRSTLFWWMLDHHDELLAAGAGRRVRWPQLCATFTTLGLTDGCGNTPSSLVARRTWHNVRLFAAKVRAAGAVAPSRMGRLARMVAA